MIHCQNYTINVVALEVDDFRGPTLSMNIKSLVNNKLIHTTLYDAGHTDRFAFFELNLSPTQSGPSASILGYTGSGIDIDGGGWRYDISIGNQLLETGLMTVSGNNNSIY